MVATLLTQRKYAHLLQDIKRLVSNADEVASAEKVSGFWEVGKRILDEKLETEAGYHNSILRDLAADSKIPLRNLQRAVALTSAYPKSPPKPDGLTWTHYRVLVSVHDKKERDAFRKLAIAEQWTGRQLEAAIKAGLNNQGELKSTALERPTEPDFVYKAALATIVDGDTLDLDIDLGFHTTRRQRVRLALIDVSEDKRSKVAREAKTFVARALLSAQTIAVKTERVDLHGRYVAHIFYLSHEATSAECFANGQYLNAQLLDAKLARPSV
jgi:endonuclease YncB( thermonuclease family)